MNLTRNALGNLVNRYKAVLKKCHLLNTFGSLAVAGMLMLGGVGLAGAATNLSDIVSETNTPNATIGAGDLTIQGDHFFGAVVEDPNAAGVVDFTVSGAGVNLTLTGNNIAAGSDGHLSVGNAEIKGGATLTLYGRTSHWTNRFEGNISVDGSNSVLNILSLNPPPPTEQVDGVEMSTEGTLNFYDVNLSNSATLNITGSALTVGSLIQDTTAQVNVGADGKFANLGHFDAFSSTVERFSDTAADGKIFIGTQAAFASGSITFTTAGDFKIATDGVYSGSIATTKLTLAAGTTTIKGGIFFLIGGAGPFQLSGGTLAVDNAASKISVIQDDWTTDATSPLNIINGKLEIIETATLTVGADVTLGAGGTLAVGSTATLDISDDTLTANLKDFGTIDLSTATFTEGGTVESNLVGNAGTTLALVNTGLSGSLYSDEYDALMTSLKTQIFGDANFAGSITLAGVGLHSTLDNLNDSNDDPNKPMGAGTYSSTTDSVIAGLVAADQGGTIINSTINSVGGSLSLTGNNVAMLSPGDIIVKQGTLNLGYDGATKTTGGTLLGVEADGSNSQVFVYGTNVTTKGNVEIQNGGKVTAMAGSGFSVGDGIWVEGNGSVFIANENVTTGGIALYSGGAVNIAANKTITVNGTMEIGGNMDVGDGTLQAKGFSNITTDLNLTGGTLKTTDGLTTTKNITIAGGANLDIAGGVVDVSGIVFTADATSLSSASGTELIVDNATVGASDDGETITAASATVTGQNNDTLLGEVTIKGFTGTATNKLELDYATDYKDLVAAAKDTYGDKATINLENVTSKTDSTNLHDVEGDTSLSKNTVKVDPNDPTSNQLGANTTTIVGSVTNSINGVAVNNAGDAKITGEATDDPTRTGIIADGDIVTTGAGNTNLGNTQAQSTLNGDVDSSGSSGATDITKVDVKGDITGGSGTTTVADSTAENLTSDKGDTFVEGTVEIVTRIATKKITIKAGSTLKTKDLTGTDVEINIGDTNGAGGLIVTGTTSTVGGYIKYDPPIVPGEGIDKAAPGVHNSFGANGIATTHNVIQNSIAVFGDTDTTWALNEFGKSKLTWGNGTGEVNAALFIRAPQTLNTTLAGSTGAVEVDGSQTIGRTLTAGTAIFADKSLLVVDAAGVGSGTALSGAGKLTVDTTSKLLIANGKGSQVITVTDFADSGNSVGTNAWGLGDGSNIYTTSAGLKIGSVVWDDATGVFQVTLQAGISDVMKPYFADESISYLTNAFNIVSTDTDSNRGGVKFLSRALDGGATYKMGEANPKLAAATIEGAAQLAGVANTAGAIMGVANTAGNAIVSHNSGIGLGTTQGEGSGSVTMNNGEITAETGTNGGNMADKAGLGIWLTPMYKWNSGHGFEGGSLEHDYDMGLGGIALGVDFTNRIDHETAVRFGLAFNVGAGYSDSTGDFNETNNDFNFWGLSLYGAFQKENFVATLDLGFNSSYNDVTQDLPSTMGMSDLEADVDSFVFTAGLNLEYTFNAGMMDITPHAGVRYMSATTYGYDIESGGALVASVDEDTQSVWYFPVGVTFSADMESASGWTFTPKLDLGFIAAAGDLEATSKTRFTGVPGTMELSMQNVDGFAFNGGLGFELSNEESGISIGLNYNLQAGEKETGHMIFANFRYDF